VIEYGLLPAVNPVVAQVATSLPFTVCEAHPPITVSPFKKSTVPVGEPTPGLTTEMVAVKVTLCPETDGFVPLVTTVLVVAVSTPSLIGLPLLFEPA
jgi:hypothetical protein